ncbi:MAG: hypothetical protein M3040_13205 [Bacteroidota bacterium]|nr:hypothetical protein [Bacteroidota bacterium]
MAIALTHVEMMLVTDREILLTKNHIIQKVTNVFGAIAERYKIIISESELHNESITTGKISKGENYNGLPYIMLDYPRQFAKGDVFAIRTFFWWGNFFSITLQLGGHWQQKFLPAIQHAIRRNLLEGWFLGCSDTPWDHHFEEDNYAPVRQQSADALPALLHIKIAKKIPLSEWNNMETFFEENFSLLIRVLGNYAPIL